MEWVNLELEEIAIFNPESINKNYPFNQIDYIDISSVGSGDLKQTVSYEISKAPSRAKRIVKKGDTILSTVRPNRRSFLYLKKPSENQIVSTGFAVLRAKENIDPRFLYYLISNQEFTNYLVSQEQGAAYPAVNIDSIKKAKVLVPDRKTQEKISFILGNFDDKIESNININNILEEIIKEIYKFYFVDFEPFINELVDSGVGKVPKGWRMGNVGDLTKVSSGKRPNSISHQGEVPIFGGAGCMGFADDYLFNEELFVIGRVGAYCGSEVFRIENKVWPSDNALVVQLKSSDYYSLVYSILSTFNFDSIKGGSSQPLITQSGVKNISTVIPPLEVIKEFNEKVKPLHQKININIRENIVLNQTRDYLLPKLLTGDLELVL